MSAFNDSRKIRRHYDRIAHNYDEWISDRQIKQLEVIASLLPEVLPKPALDIGAGTGLLSRVLGLDVVNFDLSRQMLANSVGLRCQGDWGRLPFRAKSFGTVFSVSVLQTLTNPLPKLDEMGRVMKSGGHFYLTVLKTEDLAQVEGCLKALNFEKVKRTDAMDALLFWGKKSFG